MIIHCVAASAGLISLLLLGCEQPAREINSSPVASGTPDGDNPAASAAALAARAPAPRAPAEHRVALVVLPGDASVKVNGQPAWRRDGVIELAGKPGEKFDILAFKHTHAGITSREVKVAIDKAGASPPIIDLNAPPTPDAASQVVNIRKPVHYGRYFY